MRLTLNIHRAVIERSQGSQILPEARKTQLQTDTACLEALSNTGRCPRFRQGFSYAGTELAVDIRCIRWYFASEVAASATTTPARIAASTRTDYHGFAPPTFSLPRGHGRHRGIASGRPSTPRPFHYPKSPRKQKEK